MQGAVPSSRTEGDHVRKELRISKRDPLLPNQGWELNLIGKGGFAANCGGQVQWVLTRTVLHEASVVGPAVEQEVTHNGASGLRLVLSMMSTGYCKYSLGLPHTAAVVQ